VLAGGVRSIGSCVAELAVLATGVAYAWDADSRDGSGCLAAGCDTFDLTSTAGDCPARSATLAAGPSGAVDVVDVVAAVDDAADVDDFDSRAAVGTGTMF
jgi:hypothetical protein